MDKSPNWDREWNSIRVADQKTLEDGLFKNLLNHFVPVAKLPNLHAIEIGCFPGKFIDHIGHLGYTIHGIDTYPNVTDIATWCLNNGRNVGNFINSSLEDYSNLSQEKFEIVLSLGFIEHFNNFCDVIYQHVKLCKLGGRIIIGCPNFASPIQRGIHRSIDLVNINNHVLEAMYPSVWKILLAAIGVNVQFSGPIGGFHFWTGSQPINRRVQGLQQVITQLSSISNILSDTVNLDEAGYLLIVGEKKIEIPEKEELKELFDSCLDVARLLSYKDSQASSSVEKFINYLHE